MSTFTEAEIDDMSGDQLRTELRGMGEERATVNRMRVTELKALMKTRCGITAATAPPAQNPPGGGGGGSGNPAGNPPPQALNDLTRDLAQERIIVEQRFANSCADNLGCQQKIRETGDCQ